MGCMKLPHGPSVAVNQWFDATVVFNIQTGTECTEYRQFAFQNNFKQIYHIVLALHIYPALIAFVQCA